MTRHPMTRRRWLSFLLLAGFLAAPVLGTQPPPDEKKDFFKGFGTGGFGGPMGQERKVVAQFDKDKDGRLNQEERQAAREFLKKERPKGGPGGFGRGGFMGGDGMTKPLLETLDSDKDGKLTKKEVLAGISKFLGEGHKKGALDETQLANRLQDLLPRPPGFPKGPPEGLPKDNKDGPKEGGPRIIFFDPGRPLAAGIMQRADADKDRKVTLEE